MTFAPTISLAENASFDSVTNDKQISRTFSAEKVQVSVIPIKEVFATPAPPVANTINCPRALINGSSASAVPNNKNLQTPVNLYEHIMVHHHLFQVR